MKVLITMVEDVEERGLVRGNQFLVDQDDVDGSTTVAFRDAEWMTWPAPRPALIRLDVVPEEPPC